MTHAALDRALSRIPATYAGPGGAIALLRAGEVLVRHAWGWADRERRIAFTPSTLFRICSISKQFTCATMLDNFPDPSVLDGDIAARVPLLTGQRPRTIDLANNQSGLRDYWATAMLLGSPVEAPFGEAEARALIGRTRSLHFAPGSRYSYCNHNFRLIGDATAERAGASLAELMRRVFARAGMATARLHADTSEMPDGTIGYEGGVEAGFRPAVNRITWTGDAGVIASLDDMIAWERFIDATREDAGGLYRRLSVPMRFSDGAPAGYGLGLSRGTLLGRAITGHGGGLRGWRSFRFNMPEERVSVVCLFNHMADARAAGADLAGALLDAPAKPTPPDPPAAWAGAFTEPVTGLVTRLETLPDQRVRLHFSGGAELLDQLEGGEAGNGTVRLRRAGDGIWMDRATDNLSSRLVPVEGEAALDVAGRFHSDEYDADFTCADAGGALYGAFSGVLGQGMMEPMIAVGPDLWRLPFPRALDHSPPGDWTLAFHRDGAGRVDRVEIGCWLARRIGFARV
jgi:D-aminopeptidase